MTIKQLKERIKNLPDEMEVIMQKDPEGNGYSPADGVDPNTVYIEGDVYDMDWSAEDACMEEVEWEDLKKKPRALVLYPKY